MDRVVNAFKALRSSAMNLIKYGLHPKALNPVSSAKIVKQISIPRALYGRELWGELSLTELMLLERAQRFVAKSMQGLHRRTRSDMCILGWTTVDSYIDVYNCPLQFSAT